MAKNNRFNLVALAALVISALILTTTADSTPIANARKFFGLWRTAEFGIALIFLGTSLAFALWSVSKNLFLAFVSAAFSVGAVILLAEIATYSEIVDWRKVFTPQVTVTGWDAVPNLDVSGTSYQDTASAWGLDTTPIPFSFKTDRYGFRNTPDRSSAEIYLIGDSILVGALIPENELVSSKLEEKLRVPVMQIALIGKAPQRMQEVFIESGLELSDRMVFQFVFEGNDLADSREYLIKRNGTDLSTASFRDRSLTNQIVLAGQLLTQPIASNAKLNTCRIGSQLYTFAWLRNSFEGLDEELSNISNSLEQFNELITSRGGRFAVVFVPSKFRVLSPLCEFSAVSAIRDYQHHLSSLPGYLRDWSAQSGIPVIDLTPSLTDASIAGSIPWLWGDTHWNALGHSVAASELKDWMSERVDLDNRDVNKIEVHNRGSKIESEG